MQNVKHVRLFDSLCESIFDICLMHRKYNFIHYGISVETLSAIFRISSEIFSGILYT